MRSRDINRWHVIGVLLFAVPLAVIVWIGLMKVCGPAKLGKPTYCGWEETWLWITSVGDWRLWVLAGLLAVGMLGALPGPDESADQDQRN